MTKSRLLSLLQRLPPGLIEIYTHPAILNTFAGHAPEYDYTGELAALTDPLCADALKRSGRTFGGYIDSFVGARRQVGIVTQISAGPRRQGGS
jgi:chitin disaccharide deacetylase